MPIRRPLLIAVALMALPGTGIAGFVDETAAPAPKVAATAESTPIPPPVPVPEIPVRLEGNAPSLIPPAKGMGRQLPLSVALVQFIPSNFRIVMSDQVDSAKPVDWMGRPQWITTLAEVIKAAGVVAVIDWQREVVTVKTSFAEPDKPATWTLNAGDRVSMRFDEWAKQNGWQLAWETKELVVDGVDMTATGTFMEAVSAFIEALNQGGADIRVRFYMDNSPQVLRVTERSRQQ